jgi:hypothetical protein
VLATELMDLMFDTMRVRNRDDPSPHATRREAAIAALGSMNARDPVDLMFAAHAVASHHATMECFRRAMLAVNDPDAASRMHRSAMGLSRMMAETVKDLASRRAPFLVARHPMHREDAPPALGRLRNGNPFGNPHTAPRCGARNRAGLPCRAPAMAMVAAAATAARAPALPRGGPRRSRAHRARLPRCRGPRDPSRGRRAQGRRRRLIRALRQRAAG